MTHQQKPMQERVRHKPRDELNYAVIIARVPEPGVKMGGIVYLSRSKREANRSACGNIELMLTGRHSAFAVVLGFLKGKWRKGDVYATDNDALIMGEASKPVGYKDWPQLLLSDGQLIPPYERKGDAS